MEGTPTMTTAAQLKASREYRARRRLIDPAFVAAEQEARQRYARKLYRFSKKARAFAKAFPEAFRKFSEFLK
jgi:hypothetical protein